MLPILGCGCNLSATYCSCTCTLFLSSNSFTSLINLNKYLDQALFSFLIVILLKRFLPLTSLFFLFLFYTIVFSAQELFIVILLLVPHFNSICFDHKYHLYDMNARVYLFRRWRVRLNGSTQKNKTNISSSLYLINQPAQLFSASRSYHALTIDRTIVIPSVR